MCRSGGETIENPGRNLGRSGLGDQAREDDGSGLVARPCPIDSLITLPPPKTTSSPAFPGPPLRSSVTSISRSVSAKRIRSPTVGP